MESTSYSSGPASNFVCNPRAPAFVPRPQSVGNLEGLPLEILEPCYELALPGPRIIDMIPLSSRLFVDLSDGSVASQSQQHGLALLQVTPTSRRVTLRNFTVLHPTEGYSLPAPMFIKHGEDIALFQTAYAAYVYGDPAYLDQNSHIIERVAIRVDLMDLDPRDWSVRSPAHDDYILEVASKICAAVDAMIGVRECMLVEENENPEGLQYLMSLLEIYKALPKDLSVDRDLSNVTFVHVQMATVNAVGPHIKRYWGNRFDRRLNDEFSDDDYPNDSFYDDHQSDNEMDQEFPYRHRPKNYRDATTQTEDSLQRQPSNAGANLPIRCDDLLESMAGGFIGNHDGQELSSLYVEQIEEEDLYD